MISVIVPVYHVEEYLDRCVESIVAQTYHDLEIILVDDGSQDGSPEKCDKWAEKDARIKVIHKKNGGLSDARNAGLENASGDYIAFVDSDDFMEQDMYQSLINALEKYHSVIAICGRYIYDNVSSSKKVAHMSKQDAVLSTQQAIGELLKGDIVEEAAWDKLFHRRLFHEVRFPVGEINEDIVVMPKVFERASSVVTVAKPLYYYCNHSNSITRSTYSPKKLIVKKHMEDVSDYILSKCPGLKTEVSIFQGRYAISQLFSYFDDPQLKNKYPSHYQYYLKSIKACYINLLISSAVPIKRKMQVTMMCMGLYAPYCRLKRLYNRYLRRQQL